MGKPAETPLCVEREVTLLPASNMSNPSTSGCRAQHTFNHHFTHKLIIKELTSIRFSFSFQGRYYAHTKFSHILKWRCYITLSARVSEFQLPKLESNLCTYSSETSLICAEGQTWQCPFPWLYGVAQVKDVTSICKANHLRQMIIE